MTEAEHLRDEARKCRYFAAAVGDERSRDELLKLAADYSSRASELDSDKVK